MASHPGYNTRKYWIHSQVYSWLKPIDGCNAIKSTFQSSELYTFSDFVTRCKTNCYTCTWRKNIIECIFQTKSSFSSGKVKMVFQYIIWHPMMALWNPLLYTGITLSLRIKVYENLENYFYVCFTFKEPSLYWTPYHMIVNKWSPSIYWEVICISTCTSQQYTINNSLWGQ